MIGVGGYQAWALRRSLELLERTRDRYPYGGSTSPRYRLEQINEAFANADQGKAIRTALICAGSRRGLSGQAAPSGHDAALPGLFLLLVSASRARACP